MTTIPKTIVYYQKREHELSIEYVYGPYEEERDFKKFIVVTYPTSIKIDPVLIHFGLQISSIGRFTK